MLQNIFYGVKSFFGGEYFLYALLTIAIIFALIFFTFLIVTLTACKDFSSAFEKTSNTIAVFLCIILTCELDYSKKYITSFFDVFIILLFFTVVIKILTKLLTLISKLSNKKPLSKPEIVVPKQDVFSDVILPDKTDAVKRAIERLACKGENTCYYTGYVDVSHVKSLIDGVKQKDLSLDDQKFLEKAELNLLNFISRQPTPDERIVLSEQIGSLVKLIAKYQ